MRAQPPHMATSSECRYRWLRLPATNLAACLKRLSEGRLLGGFSCFWANGNDIITARRQRCRVTLRIEAKRRSVATGQSSFR